MYFTTNYFVPRVDLIKLLVAFSGNNLHDLERKSFFKIEHRAEQISTMLNQGAKMRQSH